MKLLGSAYGKLNSGRFFYNKSIYFFTGERKDTENAIVSNTAAPWTWLYETISHVSNANVFYRCDFKMYITLKRVDKFFFKWSPDNP